MTCNCASSHTHTHTRTHTRTHQNPPKKCSLTCSGRRKPSESFHQRWSLTAVSTALVVSPVVVSTSMVFAVVRCSRSPAVPAAEPTEAWGQGTAARGGGGQKTRRPRYSSVSHCGTRESLFIQNPDSDLYCDIKPMGTFGAEDSWVSVW